MATSTTVTSATIERVLATAKKQFPDCVLQVLHVKTGRLAECLRLSDEATATATTAGLSSGVRVRVRGAMADFGGIEPTDGDKYVMRRGATDITLRLLSHKLHPTSGTILLELGDEYRG